VKNIITLVLCLISLVSVSGCSKVNENTVPSHIQLSVFNNVPGQCEELLTNLGKIPVYKMGHIYKYKAVFEDISFSPAAHLSFHKEDVAMAVDMGDHTIQVVILTDNLPTIKYLHAGRH